MIARCKRLSTRKMHPISGKAVPKSAKKQRGLDDARAKNRRDAASDKALHMGAWVKSLISGVTK